MSHSASDARLLAAPELARGRAKTLAGLAASGAAAFAAGVLVIDQPVGSYSQRADLAAIATLALLLASVAAWGWGCVYSGGGSDAEEELDAAEGLAKSIGHFIKAGGVFGALALIGICCTFGLRLLDAADTAVSLSLTPEELTRVAALCPAIENPVNGVLAESPVGAPDDYIPVHVSDERCGSEAVLVRLAEAAVSVKQSP